MMNQNAFTASTNFDLMPPDEIRLLGGHYNEDNRDSANMIFDVSGKKIKFVNAYRSKTSWDTQSIAGILADMQDIFKSVKEEFGRDFVYGNFFMVGRTPRELSVVFYDSEDCEVIQFNCEEMKVIME